jgi:hypothetical protein
MTTTDSYRENHNHHPPPQSSEKEGRESGKVKDEMVNSKL